MGHRLLGGLEHVVLLAVMQLEDEQRYAVPIRRMIKERGQRSISRGALYTVLERLEAKEFLASEMAPSTAERGGRPRRLYHVTPLGLSAVQLSANTLAALSEGLEAALGSVPNE